MLMQYNPQQVFNLFFSYQRNKRKQIKNSHFLASSLDLIYITYRIYFFMYVLHLFLANKMRATQKNTSKQQPKIGILFEGI